MSYCKISNTIFDLGLDVQELSIYVYLSGLPSDMPSFDGNVVSVKQSTIASKCGIKAVQTVSKIIARLIDKGLIDSLGRSKKRNGYNGTYSYNVKKLPTQDSFFTFDRYIFGRLNPRQLVVYLFICKSFSFQINDCWNSYNDISRQTGLKRETAISTVNELANMKLIVRFRRRSKSNRRVYVDNHYQIIPYISRKSLRKGLTRLHLEYNRARKLKVRYPSTHLQHDYITLLSKSQDFSERLFNFFSCRGSP